MKKTTTTTIKVVSVFAPNCDSELHTHLQNSHTHTETSVPGGI